MEFAKWACLNCGQSIELRARARDELQPLRLQQVIVSGAVASRANIIVGLPPSLVVAVAESCLQALGK